MPFPATLNEMTRAGYKFSSHGVCKGCHASIEWWITPEGKPMPMNLMLNGTSEAISHFATCPNAEAFRIAERSFTMNESLKNEGAKPK